MGAVPSIVVGEQEYYVLYGINFCHASFQQCLQQIRTISETHPLILSLSVGSCMLIMWCGVCHVYPLLMLSLCILQLASFPNHRYLHRAGPFYRINVYRVDGGGGRRGGGLQLKKHVS